MAKISLSSITSNYASVSQLNNYFQSIEDLINDNVLFRDNPEGEPNQMESNLDMNSNRILNLPTALEDSEPVTLSQLVDFSLTVETSGIGAALVAAEAARDAAQDYKDDSEDIYTDIIAINQSVALKLDGASVVLEEARNLPNTDYSTLNTTNQDWGSVVTSADFVNEAVATTRSDLAISTGSYDFVVLP